MRSRYWVAAILTLGTASPLSAQSVRAGIEAWQKADYSTAVGIWRPLAEKGNADASFNLGQAYRTGRGVPQDLAQAQSWFERAARQGHLNAQTTLGLMLFQNGNRIAGLRWLKQSADRDDPRALLIYGTALFNGDGVQRDPGLGYAYVKRASDLGLAAASDTLADIEAILPEPERRRARAQAAAKPAQQAPAKPDKPLPVKKVAASPKVAAPKIAAATGPWRIQLGAFTRRASAEALYKSLAGQAALAGRKPFYVAAGEITRLQVGPFPTSADAQAACAALRSQACFPTQAK
jgi:cell division septation protein DedD